MRKLIFVVPRAIAGAALFSVLAVVPGTVVAADKIVAQSGKASVTQAELETFLRALDAPSRARLAADKTTLERLVQSRLAQKSVLAEAESKGWARRPEVAAMVLDAEQSVIVRSYLESVTQPPQGYPSDTEIKAAYDASPAVFTAPKLYHVAQIYVAAEGDEAARANARKEAESIARQARGAGADFAALARARSQEPRSAVNGGDTGWLPETEMLPEIRAAVVALKPGAVSEPVRSPTGLHVLKLIAVREAGLRPLDEVREPLRAKLRQQYQSDAAQAYLKQQTAASAASVDQSALDSVISAVR